MLLGLDGVQVVAVQRQDHRLRVTVQAPWQLVGCPDCGVVALSTGRRTRVVHDVPGIVPVEVAWRQRRWACPDPGCPRGTFSKQIPGLVAPRGSLTTRAIRWAIGQLRAEHATIAGLARRLGVSWWTLWRVVKPHLQALAADESRFAGVATLGADATGDQVQQPGVDTTVGVTGQIDHPCEHPGPLTAVLCGVWCHPCSSTAAQRIRGRRPANSRAARSGSTSPVAAPSSSDPAAAPRRSHPKARPAASLSP